jgi:hypothetical protein
MFSRLLRWFDRILHWFAQCIVFLSVFALVVLVGFALLDGIYEPPDKSARQTFLDVARELGIDEPDVSDACE